MLESLFIRVAGLEEHLRTTPSVAKIKNSTVNTAFPIWPIYVSQILNKVPKYKDTNIKI